MITFEHSHSSFTIIAELASTVLVENRSLNIDRLIISFSGFLNNYRLRHTKIMYTEYT